MAVVVSKSERTALLYALSAHPSAVGKSRRGRGATMRALVGKDLGVVVELADGREYQIRIVRSR